MSVIRRAQEGQFTIMPNATVRDPRLSLDALGLLLRLVSRPPNWETRPKSVMRECGIGDSRWRRLSGELVRAGYLTREQERQEDGTWQWVYTVYQESQNPEDEENHESSARRGKSTRGLSTHGSSMDGASTAGKPTRLINTEETKTEIKKIEGELGELSRRDLVVTDEMRTWAVENAPLVDLQWETQVFQQHPRGVDQRYRSQEALQAAWRTWIMRGQQFAERDHRQVPGPDRTPHKTVSPVDTLSDTSWAEGGW
jgi:hypothetical protein